MKKFHFFLIYPYPTNDIGPCHFPNYWSKLKELSLDAKLCFFCAKVMLLGYDFCFGLGCIVIE